MHVNLRYCEIAVLDDVATCLMYAHDGGGLKSAAELENA